MCGTYSCSRLFVLVYNIDIEPRQVYCSLLFPDRVVDMPTARKALKAMGHG